MSRKDWKRTLLLLGLALVLGVSGLVVGSNMGFRMKLRIDQASRDHWISLPYRNEMRRASDICEMLGPEGTLVSRFNTVLDVREDWTCPYGNDFAVTAGEGYFVRVATASRPIVEGSHDPDLLVPLGGFRSVHNDYFLSVPYHTTALRAHDLCLEIPNAALVSRFDPTLNRREDWTCPYGWNFQIRPGESVAVRVSATNPGWLPSHY